jgi:hypothetical protein
MAEEVPDREEDRHREVLQRYREQIQRERALMEQIHREAVERHREEEERGRALIERIHREAVERARSSPPLPSPEPQTIHYLDQPEPRPGDLLFAEWTTYRREAGRLLVEGKEGQYVLVSCAASACRGSFLILPWLREGPAGVVGRAWGWPGPFIPPRFAVEYRVTGASDRAGEMPPAEGGER